MATDARDAAVGAIPDELLLDIFARLPDPLDLLRCAGTCIRWLRLVASHDAVLLRRASVLPEKKNASLLLGAFYQNNYLIPELEAKVNIDRPPLFWRLDDLNLNRPGFSLFSKHGGLFNYAKPLASRRGLLLVRLMPSPIEYRKVHLAVCHPLLGGVHIVPPLPVVLHPTFPGRDVTGYALLTGYGGEGLHNHRQRRLAFRLLFTVVRLNGFVFAYSYSSATGNWSAPVMCPLQLRGLTMSGPRAGIVDGCGTTHWLYRDALYFYTLNISADAAHVSLTKIPILVEGEHQRRVMRTHPPFPCITEGGKLSFVFVRQPNNSILKLWTKRGQDENNGDWIHYELPMSQRSFDPFDPFDQFSTLGFRVIGFAESKGALLIKSYFAFFILDLESRELEMVVRRSEYHKHSREDCCDSNKNECQGYNSCTECAYNNCVLYEIDWSSYFLHLSAWNPRGATW